MVKTKRPSNKRYPNKVSRKPQRIFEPDTFKSLTKRELELRKKLHEILSGGAKGLIDCLDVDQSISNFRTVTRNLTKDLVLADRIINSLEKVTRQLRDFHSKEKREGSSYYIEDPNSFFTNPNITGSK